MQCIMHNKAKPWIGNGLNGNDSRKSKKQDQTCIFIQLLRQFRAHVYLNVFLLGFIAICCFISSQKNKILATSDCLHFLLCDKSKLYLTFKMFLIT